MTSIFDKFSDARVLVIGDIMLDRYWWGSVARISPEAPVPVVQLERKSVAPGGAANVAVNVSALGGKATLIGCVGGDAEAAEFREALQSKGVSADHLVSIASRRTTVKTRVVAHSQQVARIDSEDVSPIGEIDSALICEAVTSSLPNADLVIISDYAKGMLPPTVLTHVFKTSQDAGKPILVDPKGKDFSRYAGATILTPNRREAAEACGLDESTDAVAKAGERLLRELDLQNVLITEGEHGMTLFGAGDTFHVDAAAHQVFDVTGAGETGVATLGVAISAGLDLRLAVEIANFAAGIAVGQIGAGAVTLEMIRSEHDQSKAVNQSR